MLSPDEARLAVAGAAGSMEPSIRTISTLDGNELDNVRSDGRWDELILHGSTLIATGNAGRLILLDECKQRREMRAATSGINDVAVLGGGLLCACAISARPALPAASRRRIAFQEHAARSFLARIATLCNENSPNAVTPHGGEGLLAVKGHPPTVVRVAIVNTRNEPRLEVRRNAEGSHRQ